MWFHSMEVHTAGAHASLRKHTYIRGNKISMLGNCSNKLGMGLVLQGNCFFT